MPRPLRIGFEGAIYHVMNRGDRREPIFRDLPAGRQVPRIESGSSKPWAGLHASLDFKSQIADCRFLPGGTYRARFNRRHLGMSGIECRMSKEGGAARLAYQDLP